MHALAPAWRLLVLAAIAVALVVAHPRAAHAAPATVTLDDPITDNYKASYNADPTAPENRTWLSMRSLTVDGTTWAPTPPAAITVTNGGSVSVAGADGRVGTLRFAVSSGPIGALVVRIDPTSAESGGRWGPLVTVTDRDTLRTTPGWVSISLTVDGAELGTGAASYRFDQALANVASDHVEYNGPGGRWWVGGVATRTNWEPVPATPPSLAATATDPIATRPRIARIWLPVRTTRRTVTMRVRGRSAGGVRITHVRTRIDARRWGHWTTVRVRYRVVLPAGAARHVVAVQLRDAQARTSPVVRRRITCDC